MKVWKWTLFILGSMVALIAVSLGVYAMQKTIRISIYENQIRDAITDFRELLTQMDSTLSEEGYSPEYVFMVDGKVGVFFYDETISIDGEQTTGALLLLTVSDDVDTSDLVEIQIDDDGTYHLPSYWYAASSTTSILSAKSAANRVLFRNLVLTETQSYDILEITITSDGSECLGMMF